MKAPQLVRAAALILLCASFTPGAGASAIPREDLSLEGKLSLAGSAELHTESAAAHHREAGAPTEFHLTADEVTLEYAWERGHKLGSPWQEDFQETNTEQGEASKTFSNVTGAVGSTGGIAEVLTYPARDGSVEVETTGTGGHVYAPHQAAYLTQVGIPPDAGSTNDSQDIGFWYEPESSWMAGHGSDQATVSGDFSVFVNNMTVTLQQDGETVWHNWTGYREEDTGPTASSYERHLLKIHVTNGTLRLAGDDAVSVFGSLLELDATGVVTAQAATGRLDLKEEVFAFDDESVRLEGEGGFQVTETETPAESGLALSVRDDSQFDVHGGQRLDTGSGSPYLAGWQAWVPGSLLAIFLAGAVAHKTGYTHKALARWRSERYTKWMTRGRELANGADYRGAVPCFRRATRAQPAKGVAWYHLTLALLEDGRPREVLDVIDEAREREAVIDELDFLELEAAAAHQAGQPERCRAAMAQLASGSEAMARSLAHELALGEEVLGSELATRLKPGGDDEELPGYV